jgi:hypothetical protein
MKEIMFILSLSFLIFSCKKAENNPIVSDKDSLETYMKNLIVPDTKPPYTGSYYVQVDFTNLTTSENKKLTFSETYQNMSLWSNPVESGLGMSVQGAIFRDSKTTEQLQISFYFVNSLDSIFKIRYANYFFSDPWNRGAGANIIYMRPVSDSDPSTFNLYLGTNSSDGYFEITYIGDNRLNGIFHTTWKECCGGNMTFDVHGDFSIPEIRHY